MFTPITDERLESFSAKTKRPNLEMEIAPLSFYEHGSLVKTTNEGVVEYWVVTTAGLDSARWTLLDGSSENIQTANELYRLRLTEDNVLAYFGFICYFLDFEIGKFEIMEAAVVSVWNKRKAVITEAPAFIRMEGDRFLCRVCGFWGEDLLEIDIAVAMNGQATRLSQRAIEPVTVH